MDRFAALAAKRGVRPDVFWHSGKLRAKQTAEAFWRACNALAELSASRDLQPGDPPAWMRDRLIGESRDILIAGALSAPARAARASAGARRCRRAFLCTVSCALKTDDGVTWVEQWRLE